MSLPLFVYGTLLDADVRLLVIGRELDDTAMPPAMLSDHGVHVLAGHSVPAAVPKPGAEIVGRLLCGLTGAEHRRIAVFEGAAYDARTVTVALADASGDSQAALVYLARPGQRTRAGGWSLEAWQQRDKPAFLHDIAGDPALGSEGGGIAGWPKRAGRR